VRPHPLACPFALVSFFLPSSFLLSLSTRFREIKHKISSALLVTGLSHDRLLEPRIRNVYGYMNNALFSWSSAVIMLNPIIDNDNLDVVFMLIK